MKIYTKKGDSGETSLGAKRKVPKDCLEIGALGAIDELNSCIGIVISCKNDMHIEKTLFDIQNGLHRIASEIAGRPRKGAQICRADIERIEREIDSYEKKLPVLSEFILPGGSNTGARIHFCRAICRRAEREIIAASKETEISHEIKAYINRLSDLFFVMARNENVGAGVPEESPKY